MTQRPNVVWIVADSVRADHTSVHAYDRDTTPNLRRIGDAGTVFENCFAHSVATAASSASILTGATPSKHQVAMGEAVGEIPEALPTAAELFAEAGYHTACVTTNPRIELIGGDAGFDRFYDVSRSTLLAPSNLRATLTFLRNLWSHSVGLTTDGLHHSFSLLVNELATRWVRSVASADDPFFLYAHYNEPHRPYLPPLPYRGRYTSDVELPASEAADRAVDLHENARRYIADGLPLSQAEWDAVGAMYDAEIAYTDEMIGDLVDAIDSLTDRETVFVITADHGELLGERDLFGHVAEVVDPLVHVPAVARNFPSTDGEAIVQHADLMHTLLAVAGAPTDRFGGVDLRDTHREFAVSQEVVPDYASFEEPDGTFDASGRPIGEIDALRTAAFKLVSHDGGTRLYELPDETTDVADSHPELVAELRGTLDEWRRTHGRPVTSKPTEDEYDERTRERLARLGYLE